MINVTDKTIFNSKKIVLLEESAKIITELKLKNKRIGLCHGGFDLLHPGHIKHFESAKENCDLLFVSVTSDRFVSLRKGSGRPVFNEQLRAYSIATLEAVDYVVISDFEKGVQIIETLQPNYYFKGPDYIGKNTSGINMEREAISRVGGEIRYTNDPKLSTTEIIDYIKNELDVKEILLVIDRDGTIIKNDDFLGKNENWKRELEYNDEVINLISHLQTKNKTTKIVVSNQAGVARGYFNTKLVEEINDTIDEELKKRGILINSWQFCPDVDSKYAEKKKDVINFDYDYVKEKTKRKPENSMVFDALKELGKDITKFNDIIVIGNQEDDKLLAKNINAKFIDVNEKKYKQMLIELS
ncbi:HAD-IIIA family hydrolase [Candidatus Woesearchaeota archaeon]|nr:hypothetical protein [uncultured archaeon]MBS3124394.1 HAD-IIIA family hydrolase [Candidatus Woesearchaeota archaeon]